MTNIVLIGIKGSGKSTIGSLLSKSINYQYVDLDIEIEKEHKKTKKENLTCREIFKKYGIRYFRTLESKTLKKTVNNKKEKRFILSCGGGTPLTKNNIQILQTLGKIFLLDINVKKALDRTIKNGVPSFIKKSNIQSSFEDIMNKRLKKYRQIADKKIITDHQKPKNIVKKIINEIT